MILKMKHVREKGISVKEISGNCPGNFSSRFGRHADLLLTFNIVFIACRPQTFSSCFQELLIFYTFRLQFWCRTRVLVAFKANIKGVVFANPILSHCSSSSFQATLLATPIFVGICRFTPPAGNPLRCP